MLFTIRNGLPHQGRRWPPALIFSLLAGPSQALLIPPLPPRKFWASCAMADVKICGLSTLESVDAAIDAGAALVGLVFYPRSPRHVSLQQAKQLAVHARGRAKIVA